MLETYNKPTLLYVDDEQHNLDAFSAAFRRNYTIYTSLSAKEGFKILKEHDIEIVITDQRMPEMTGVQFLEIVAQEFPSVIRIIITAYTDLNALIRAINMGKIFAYITKPWNNLELQQVVDKAVSFHRLEKRNQELVLDLQSQMSDQQKIMDIFKRFVPETIINDLKEREGVSLLHGESRIVSILIVDIRGFTKIASNLDPSDVVRYINHFFTMVSECVSAHNGSINKFLGDGVLAIFGAPLSYIDNTYNAVAAAVDIINQLVHFNEENQDKIKAVTEIGIGISTGEAIVGNIGTADKIEYTVIGNTVNMASKIQELTKDQPNSILIDTRTYKAVKDRVMVDTLENKKIPGKDETVNLYRVLGISVEISTVQGAK